MMKIQTDVFCGSQMRMARILHNIKLDDLAEKTKIEKKKLWSFERGVELPNQEEEAVIAKSLKVEPKFFYWTDTSPLLEDECTFSARMRRM